MNPLTRLFRTLASPSEVMAGLVQQPVWLAPLLTIAIVASLCGSVMVFALDFDTMIKETREREIQKLPAAQKRALDNLTDEQRASQERVLGYVMQGVKVFTIIGPFLSVPLVVLIVSGVLYFLANLQGADTDFRQVLSMVAHTWYVTAVASVVTVGLIGLTGRMEQVLSAAIVLSEDSAGSVAFHLLNRLSVFGLWQLALTAIGMQQVVGLSGRRAWSTVVGVWLFWSLLVILVSLLPRLAG